MATWLDPARQAMAEAGRQHGAVNFDVLLEHYIGAFPPRRREGVSEREIAQREERFQEMLAAFEDDEGRVRSQKWCPRIESGAVLTAKRPKSDLRRALSGDTIRYFAGGNPVETDADLKLAELMARADREAQRVADLLSNPRRGSALKQLYDVRATALEGFEELARRRMTGQAEARLRRVLERQVAAKLKAATEYAERSMRLRAAILFQLGMLSGVVMLLLFAIFLLVTFNGVRAEGRLIGGTEYVPTALMLGGLGAVISVLQRITRGQVATSLENGLTACFLLGFFRPIIGAVLSFAIIILILGDVVPIDVPDAADTRAFFLGGIAFLAGFSERYAQTMLGAAKTGGSAVDETTTTATTTTTTTSTDADTDLDLDTATDAETDTNTGTAKGTDSHTDGTNGSGGAADGKNGSGGQEVLVGVGAGVGGKKDANEDEDEGIG